MMERYNFDVNHPCTYGEWVKYIDVEALEEQNKEEVNQLEANYKKAIDALYEATRLIEVIYPQAGVSENDVYTKSIIIIEDAYHYSWEDIIKKKNKNSIYPGSIYKKSWGKK